QAAAVSVPAPDGVVTLGEVFRRLDGLGIELADISLRKPSLDEAFLSLTSEAVTVRLPWWPSLSAPCRARCATPICSSRCSPRWGVSSDSRWRSATSSTPGG